MTSSQILTMKILSLAVIATYPTIHPFMKATTLNMLHLITPTIDLKQLTLVVCPNVHPLRKATTMNMLHLITLNFTLNLNLLTLTMMRIIHPIMAMATNLDNPPHCETRRVVKSNLKGCKVIKLMKSVVFRDHGIYHF